VHFHYHSFTKPKEKQMQFILPITPLHQEKSISLTATFSFFVPGTKKKKDSVLFALFSPARVEYIYAT